MKKGVPSSIRVVGLAAYHREDYSRILEIMKDGDKLHLTWEIWNKAFNRTKLRHESDGHTVIAAIISPDEFLDWCASRGLKPNSEARARYAKEEALRVASKTH